MSELSRQSYLADELRARRACLVGAKQTLEMVAATLRNAESIDLARLTLDVPLNERIALVDEAISSTDAALRSSQSEGRHG
jgi:hypothetical protein